VALPRKQVISIGKIEIDDRLFYRVISKSVSQRSAGKRIGGYLSSILSGEVIMANGEPTGILPGRLLRGTRGI
jgi:hypothetical protein